ncbi:tRNA (N6-dimethylallyl-A37)-dimethylallyltransferase [Syntrophotalea carbinolica DSM 2380]|uniref:tRNA dimethylallyltransferase 1 n=1 Tax=Syntrophotalea carbinolica (strain DSM 2380 / NBRC 103641 / GraBd1) TaxID=338963 RepID=MIAA1_SYNC1|nr:tRNA (adenosine(37)-N6)-dimethylallyltransferase MiaA [Syntrophotalea carbinolica]Q3A503.1 RecName: Full=tRNA dimethylallyltransferase 1; AltName: Full=Dimethylallyl diphosphate:tRNA dimethylallyltransferase 1; Short=DMAPP:tRNA dimethylallyltransferase 1; Short=DMATase 1; AltName: Full=Isopentenyl-diphosphate:tRNA isopentenyltransferase 1; Short=IPP transferase 1; Short=IPPT 1; Short=IPTase 1 [Syntrophotalea carbinolica DSM 2380]ABA88554.1 tRNA (N6-dimethylallyl-A37)-dimethylallyltransferase [
MIFDHNDKRPPIVVLCGPTAAGKTALAVRLAGELPVEVVSADSRQVYRHMDIGTAKPTSEELAAVPHHLIDVVDPDENFTAGNFCRLGRQALNDILGRNRLPIVVGGTGLYIQALLHGLIDVPDGDSELRATLLRAEQLHGEGTLYQRLQIVDPVLAKRLPPNDLVRIVRGLEVYELCNRRLSDLQAEHAGQKSPYRVLTLGLTMSREALYERINHRVWRMLEDGLAQEVEFLLKRGYAAECKAMQTIGYRELVQHVLGNLSMDEAVRLIQRDTRRYAKRQLTWFNKVNSIIWLDSFGEFAKVLKLIDSFIYAA